MTDPVYALRQQYRGKRTEPIESFWWVEIHSIEGRAVREDDKEILVKLRNGRIAHIPKEDLRNRYRVADGTQ